VCVCVGGGARARVCKLTEYQIFLHISTIEPKVTKNSIKMLQIFVQL